MTGPEHDPDHWADHSPYDDDPAQDADDELGLLLIKQLPDGRLGLIGEDDDRCGHIGPRGTACTDPAGHDGSHGDGTVLRWVVRP